MTKLYKVPVRVRVCPKCGATSLPELGIDQDVASDLLEACDQLERAVRENLSAAVGGNATAWDVIVEYADKARAAVARARGDQEGDQEEGGTTHDGAD